MYKKLTILFHKKFLNKIFYYFFQKNFKINLINTNFQNLLFENIDELKKVYLSKKIFRNDIINDSDYHSHSFNVINIGKIIGGERNVNLCKKYIFQWNKQNYSVLSNIWSDKLITKRFINLIYNYDFYAISASNLEIELINKIILKHYFLILKNVTFSNIGKLSIEDIKAYIIGAFIFNNKKNYSINILLSLIKKQVDINGFHKSYNPLEQAIFINNLYEIRNVLLFFTKSAPKELSFHIFNMTSLLISLVHKDNSIALFNGSNNFKINEIQNIIKLSKDIKTKQISNIENGIAIYASKNKKIYMEIVNPTSEPIQKKIHAGTLSFEFSFLDEKIITNCGSLETKINKKSQYLKFSAAHSTIIINNTNISNLNEKISNHRIPQKITYHEIDEEEYVSWISSHDGYIKNFNKIVKREINIYKKIDKIVGKDIILNTKANSKNNTYAIRFHLMPHITCAISNNKKTVFIKTKKNQSWVFKSENTLSIEESIYISDKNKIEQSKQIVINGTIKDKNITERWTLFKS